MQPPTRDDGVWGTQLVTRAEKYLIEMGIAPNAC